MDNFVADGIDIYVTDRGDGYRRLLHYSGPDSIEWWKDITDTAGLAPDPTLTLMGEAGRALLDALSRYYEGSSDMRRLRQDFEYERTERQKLVDLLANIVRGGK